MVGNRKYEFNSFLIKSIMPTEQGISVVGDSKEQEDIVYHYTSPDAFLSIIQNQAIRFTDIRYLNDKSEGIYFVKLLLEFRDKNKGKYPYFEEAINALLIDNDAEKIKNLEVTHIKFSEIPYMPYKAERIFVFCTCTEADSLNMWNYYVNNGAYQGYNIGFKINEFLKTFDTPQQNQADSFAVYYGKVLYSSSNQTREIRYFVNGIEREIEKEAEKGSDAIGRAIKYAQLKIRSYIDSHGAFYKDSKFRSEEEFRIVIEIANDRVPRKKEDAQKYFGANNKKLLQGFCTKRGLVVPYLCVAIPKESISRVTVAPMVEYDVAYDSIHELFRSVNINNTQVHKSHIPIRF